MIGGSRGWWVLALVATALACAVAPAGAVPLRWSQAHPVDAAQGVTLGSLQCPSATECVTLDNRGRYLTYDPSVPGRPVPVAIGAASEPIALSCPSATQCTALGLGGDEVTFDPTKSRPPAPVKVDSAAVAGGAEAANDIACASTTQCVIVDGKGNVVVFDPANPSAAGTTSLNPGQDFGLESVACVSALQCTAVSETKAVTFNPAAPAGATPVVLGSKLLMTIVACPTATQCTAVDGIAGRALTFNPQAPAPTAPVAVDGESDNQLLALVCPSATQCTTTSQGGRTITFDPQTGRRRAFTVDPSPGGDVIGQYTGVIAVACVSTVSCVAVDGAGRTISFKSTASRTQPPVQIDSGSVLFGIACATPTQCTAIDTRHELTFNPFKPGTPKLRTLFTRPSGAAIAGIACPATTLCTAVRADQQVTFNPRRFRRPRPHTIDPNSDEGIVAVRCPTRTECVEADANGSAVTYNPRTAKLIRKHINVEDGESLTALACPTKTQCTVVDNNGTMLTFQPLTGRRIATAKIDKPVGLDAPSGGSNDELDGVSCTSTTFCVAVDTLGNAVRFDPRSHKPGTLAAVDEGRSLNAVACPSNTRCVLVDSAGRVLSGNPHRGALAVTPLSGASELTAVNCLAAGVCVAVDTTGDEFATRS